MPVNCEREHDGTVEGLVAVCEAAAVASLARGRATRACVCVGVQCLCKQGARRGASMAYYLVCSAVSVANGDQRTSTQGWFRMCMAK